MQSTEKRIAALEDAQMPSDELTIIRRFVAPGHLDTEIDHIRDDHGHEWTRQPGETEAAFTDRATKATPPNPFGIRCLMGKTLERSNADH